MILKAFLVVSTYIALTSGAAYHVKFHQSPLENFACTILEEDFLKAYRGLDGTDDLKYSIKSAIKPLNDHDPIDQLSEIESQAKIVEVYAHKKEQLSPFMQTMCQSYREIPQLSPAQLAQADPEIRKIVDGGDQQNRIDVVFMGDGYTASERDNFFEDMDRLTEEMFEGATFRSYLPVFNIWAIYVESEESGIGYTGPKNTPFRLYRSNGELRGIFPGNAQYARQVCRLTGDSGCDYPSIIGNDDFYGGLGGEFVISTKSNRTGTTVLRHEMGHNFVNVGEEYDDGGVYRGVNSATSVASLGWTVWLSGERREERSIYRLLEYPWQDLSRGPQTFRFTSDGGYSRWYLDISVSAAGEEDSLEFLIDGNVLPWETSGFDDREFYGWHGNEGFSAGEHNLTVRSKTAPTHPFIDRMLCSLSLHEYGSEDEFVMSPEHVSAYPTWNSAGRKLFRPTNEACLMRNMTSTSFCPVCQEGMWEQFLTRISLIDQVVVSNSSAPNGTREVTVETLKLGQLRAPGNEVAGESLEIKWFIDNVEQPALQDQFTIYARSGNWMVQVHLNTPEVRHDPRGFLTSEENFVVPS